MKCACLLILTLLPLKADGLSDLKAALGRLKGRGAVAAQAEIQFWSRSNEKGSEPQQSHASVRLEDGARGLKLGWTPAQLERRAQAKGKKAREAEGSAMKSLGIEEGLRLLRAADELIDELEGAAQVAESIETWEGHPARKVTVKLAMGMDEEDRKVLKEAKSEATFWIDPEGAPYAMTSQLDLKGRVFFISFEVHQSAQRRFQAHQGRLLMVHEDRQESGSGMGKKGEGRTILSLTPEA